jgi:hypothetical protein
MLGAARDVHTQRCIRQVANKHVIEAVIVSTCAGRCCSAVLHLKNCTRERQGDIHQIVLTKLHRALQLLVVR